MITRIRDWATRFALRTPVVRGIMERADSAIRESRMVEQESAKAVQLMGNELRYQSMRLSERMNDMMSLRIADLACRNPDKARAFAESWEQSRPTTLAQFKERNWELELALEDRGWQRENALAALEFSRYGVGQLINITRNYAIKNPLVKRGAEICAMYVFGRGLEIRCEAKRKKDQIISDPAEIATQEFLERNACELGHMALAQKEIAIQTDGNQYWGLPTGKEVNIQMIDPLEIMDVITDPDDTSKDWYYRRQWSRGVFTPAGGQVFEQQECWYPSTAVVMNPPEGFVKADFIQLKPVNWKMPLYRVKVGCPVKWRWGIPPLYASLDWARAYKDFMEDWATVQRTLARFALMIQTEGGPGAIAAYQALLSTTLADANGTQIERNPPPVVASAHIGGPETTIKAFHGAGSHTGPEQARRIGLMVATAQGMPETFYGDATTGSLATARSLDRPTELKFREIQQRWYNTMVDIMKYNVWAESGRAGSPMREADVGDDQELEFIVKFPAILEHDPEVMVKAWVDIMTLGGHQGVACGVLDRRTALEGMLNEVGYEKADELCDLIFGLNYNPAADVQNQRTEVAAQNLTKTEPAGKASTPKKGSVAEAVSHLRELIANGRN